jgi:hypothetical protein
MTSYHVENYRIVTEANGTPSVLDANRAAFGQSVGTGIHSGP